MTNSHGYVLEYPRIRVDHFDQAPVPLPVSLLAHRRSIFKNAPDVGPGVDGLTIAPGQTHFDKPLLYLLTHIHTDHLKGLDRPGITAPIYCSGATKQLLLKYERQKTRIEKDRDEATTRHVGVVRPYAHLRVTDGHATARAKLSGYQSTSHDLLHPLPYNVPTKVQYTPTSTVTLTLIESNHMFGGAMFLIQGAHGAVLHTGDMRAEEWWCDALTRNPFLSPYLCWSKQNGTAEGNDHVQTDSWADQIESLGSTTSSSLQNGDTSSQSQLESQSQDHYPSSVRGRLDTDAGSSVSNSRQSQLRLRNIYLDTELLLCNQKVPTKQQACLDMISLMRLYPSSTVFFLNCWTWGYEDMLIVTAKAFGCKIHVDRFKYIMYKAARTEAPFLADIITQDGSKTRFHACEKRNVCAAVQGLASRYSANVDPALAREAMAAHSQIDSSSPDAKQRWGPPRTQPEPLLVYVNPGQIAADRWPSMFQDTKQRLEAAQRHETAWPEALVVPIERHSTLPELQMFVGLFRPRTVSPNTILDPKGGLDYYLLHHLFGHVLAAPDDRQKLADEGLLMLGSKTWSFYETQLARAREQAQLGRNAGGADSTEAVRAASASLNAESGGESIDAWQLERLSKLRGISFKGLMMQNMAGNLAAMLEIERWRRAAGIDEPPEGLDNVIEESLGETQSKTDASVSSVDYDADHSQFLETQILPSSTAVQRRDRIMHEDEAAEVSALPDAAEEASPARMRASERLPRISSAQSFHAVEQAHDSQPSAAEGEEDEPSAALTEHLASRYLNVLIHHFQVPFHRTAASYVDMWKSVRRTLPEEAQKVEEHWFRETGVLPPLWSSQVAEHEQDIDRNISHDVEQSGGGSESKGGVMGEILTSFIDMLDPPMTDDVELVAIDTTHDRSIALQLILRHFVKLGFHDPVAESQGQSHASCTDTVSERKALSTPLSRLIKYLVSHLQIDATPSTEHREHKLLSLQLAGILLSNRPLNSVIDTSSIQAVLESLIKIVEAAPSDYSSLDRGQRQELALACAVLRAEELDEAVLEPVERRLLALAQDASGPLMRCESWASESASAFTQSVSQQPFESVDEQARTAVDQQERGSMERSLSNMPIRPPRTSNSPPIPHPASRLEADQIRAETDSILASATEHDTIDSSSSFAVVPVVEASQASSATQEEDSTQSEAESLPVLVRGDGERRGLGRTASLPSFARGVGGVRKHRLEGDDTSRDHRRTRQ